MELNVTLSLHYSTINNIMTAYSENFFSMLYAANTDKISSK